MFTPSGCKGIRKFECSAKNQSLSKCNGNNRIHLTQHKEEGRGSHVTLMILKFIFYLCKLLHDLKK